MDISMIGKTDLSKIQELILSSDPETISLGLHFFIADYPELYNDLKNKYPDKKLFNHIITSLLKGTKPDNFIANFIYSFLCFYIEGYIYERTKTTNNNSSD